jgi:hypothetical protein
MDERSLFPPGWHFARFGAIFLSCEHGRVSVRGIPFRGQTSNRHGTLAFFGKMLVSNNVGLMAERNLYKIAH